MNFININYITKAYAGKSSIINNDPTYFVSETKADAVETVWRLNDTGWLYVEMREVTKRDRTLEGIIKRCRFGSKNETRNLGYLFNLQEAER